MCENNYSIQKKEQSKYLYKHDEQWSQLFIFEIITNSNGKHSTIRRIKKENQGKLIFSNDLLIYDDINKINISVINPNNINKNIITNIILDHLSTYTIYITNQIYLEFNKNMDGYLECMYNII
jgi:hypothetical protein